MARIMKKIDISLKKLYIVKYLSLIVTILKLMFYKKIYI